MPPALHPGFGRWAALIQRVLTEAPETGDLTPLSMRWTPFLFILGAWEGAHSRRPARGVPAVPDLAAHGRPGQMNRGVPRRPGPVESGADHIDRSRPVV
jgi:hypothetical protein